MPRSFAAWTWLPPARRSASSTTRCSAAYVEPSGLISSIARGMRPLVLGPRSARFCNSAASALLDLATGDWTRCLDAITSATLRVLNADGGQSGLYRCRVRDGGATLFTHAVGVHVALARDDFAPGTGAVNAPQGARRRRQVDRHRLHRNAALLVSRQRRGSGRQGVDVAAPYRQCESAPGRHYRRRHPREPKPGCSPRTSLKRLRGPSQGRTL